MAAYTRVRREEDADMTRAKPALTHQFVAEVSLPGMGFVSEILLTAGVAPRWLIFYVAHSLRIDSDTLVVRALKSAN